MRALAVLVVCALVSDACAELKIEGDRSIAPYRMARLRATGHNPKAGLLWRWNKAVCDGFSSGGLLVITGPPGEHMIELISVCLDRDAKTALEEASFKLTVLPSLSPAPSIAPPLLSPLTAPKAPEKAPLDRATVRIWRDFIAPSGAGKKGGTGTIIGPLRQDGRLEILTAAHVAGPVGRLVDVELSGGATHKARVASASPEREADLAWLLTEEKITGDFEAATLARAAPGPGAAVWHQGKTSGGKVTGRVIRPPYSSNPFLLWADLRTENGDSGCAFFSAQTNEVVAVLRGSPTPTSPLSFGGRCELAWRYRPK